MKKLLLLFALFITVQAFSQKHVNKESYYQAAFAEYMSGETEVVLEDKTRVDVVTDVYAIEVDFSTKWAESIGQALFYSLYTHKRAGVLLIMENKEKDLKYLKRLMKVACLYNIKVWTVGTDLQFNVASCTCDCN